MDIEKKLWIGICTCHSSDAKAQAVLRKGGLEEWASYPLTRGKAACLKALSSYREQGFDTIPVEDYIRGHGSFVLFVLFSYHDQTPHHLHYVDAFKGSLEDRIRAEAMVEAFAKQKGM